MKINPNKSNALSFTRDRVKDPLNYSLGGQKIPANIWEPSIEVISDQVNYTVQKAWRALHFVMRIVKKGK